MARIIEPQLSGSIPAHGKVRGEEHPLYRTKYGGRGRNRTADTGIFNGSCDETYGATPRWDWLGTRVAEAPSGTRRHRKARFAVTKTLPIKVARFGPSNVRQAGDE